MMSFLKTPVRVGKLSLKNRLVMPPMATSKSNESGQVTEEHCRYYAERAKGGQLGLIITEHSYVALSGKAGNGQLAMVDDTCLDGLRRLVLAVHQEDTPIFAQLSHAGSAAIQRVTGCEVLGPSAILCPRTKGPGDMPREMTAVDIQEVICCFVQAAKRAKQAGFDGVEIHSAHGYLLNQFYSPLTNKRTDAYTGHTIEGRIRLHLEVIAAVREAVGADYPIALRLGVSDDMPGGTTLEDSIYAAATLERAGIDMLDISGGMCGYIRAGHKEQGYFSDFSLAIKEHVSIPVMVTGGITEAEAAEEILEQGRADLVGVGRALMKNPAWAREATMKLL